MSPNELDYDPYELRYVYSSSPKSRFYFSYLKHLREAKKRRINQRRSNKQEA